MTSAARDSIVECISLTKVFADFWGRQKVLAVDKLDLQIYPGEVFGLLGPNGSGKSTTIKMLLGLLYPTSGAARVLDKPPTDTAVKARIGFMPEESYLYRYLNAYETLDYYGRIFKLDRHERRRRTEQLIDMVGLKRAARRPIGTYSKGMARRIGLAQALINDPDLLILDEPTTGLDPVGTRQIKDVIQVLGRRGKTVILCSHLLADVEDLCGRVAIMYGGRCQALGAVSDLLERRDITQISTRSLNEKMLPLVRDAITKVGAEVLSIDHPTDRLEELFLRIVGQAQRDKLETSGAESTVGISEFLGGSANDGASVVESLVAAGAAESSATKRPLMMETVEKKAAPREDLLRQLTPDKSKSDTATRAPSPQIDAPKPDESVLNRLVKPPDEK
jgi:ABC-2 type transport system ATP-binding protein